MVAFLGGLHFFCAYAPFATPHEGSPARDCVWDIPGCHPRKSVCLPPGSCSLSWAPHLPRPQFPPCLGGAHLSVVSSEKTVQWQRARWGRCRRARHSCQAVPEGTRGTAVTGISLRLQPGGFEFRVRVPRRACPNCVGYSFHGQRTSVPQWLPKISARGLNILRHPGSENVFILLSHLLRVR